MLKTFCLMIMLYTLSSIVLGQDNGTTFTVAKKGAFTNVPCGVSWLNANMKNEIINNAHYSRACHPGFVYDANVTWARKYADAFSPGATRCRYQATIYCRR